jgi:hypothetical protein
VSFESEILLARLRGRGVRLFVPTLALCASAFALTYGVQLLHVQWELYTLYGVCVALTLFGFLFPLLRYLSAWTDITTARVVSRSGLWGQRYRAVSLAQVERVEQSSSGITLYVSGEEALELRGVPKTKLVSQELSNLVAKGAPNTVSRGI